MTRRRLTGLLMLGFTMPALASAGSVPLTTTLQHLLQGQGLSATQARSTAQTAAHHYQGTALQSVLGSVKGIPRLPAQYYSHGALKAPVAGGLTQVLTGAFRHHASAHRVGTATRAYTHAVSQGAPPKTTEQLLVSALQHGVSTASLKTLMANYLRRYKAGASAQGALHKAQGALSRYGL